MAENAKTPNNSSHEASSFPGDIPPLSTAVPAFVGYTEKAVQDKKDLTYIPVRISSMAEYQAVFGGAAGALRGLKKGAARRSPASASGARFFLYHSLQLYFANGGTACYIVCIGNYSATPAAADFLKGIDALTDEKEPTLLVAPDAMVLAAPGCFQVQQHMLAHCADLQSRFAILDIPDGFQARTEDNTDVIDVFRENMTENLSWGAVYYPWLHTDLLAGQSSDLLPPSGAIAGIYCAVDQQSGVFKAPANVEVAQVTAVAVPISNQQQEDLNAPLDGKAVNAIRNFAGQGILVWGARTLDANNLDGRYIPVRRTMIYIEQTVKNLMEPYEFGQNTPATWTAVKAVVENFLTGFWRDGGLYGAKPEEAFSVQVGLGITMTQQDIADGIMRMSVMVAMVRPAEFVVLTFQQQMTGT